MYQPMTGDFGIIKSHGIAGFAIRLGTMSRWNHAFIYIGDGKIIEARPKEGIVIKEASQYPKIAWNQHQGLTTQERIQIVEKAHSLLGRPYGFLDIAILGLRIIGFKFLGGKMLEKLALRQGIICSELVAICYNSAKVKVLDKPEYLITPGDLAEVLIYQ